MYLTLLISTGQERSYHWRIRETVTNGYSSQSDVRLWSVTMDSWCQRWNVLASVRLDINTQTVNSSSLRTLVYLLMTQCVCPITLK